LTPPDTTAASLPTAWLRGVSLFLAALAGWAGFLVLAGRDPALDPGARVAALLSALGMLAPGWLHGARQARAARRAELRRVRALLGTGSMPVLARGAAAVRRDTLPLALLAAADLPLPVYEAATGVPGREDAGPGHPDAREGVSSRPVECPGRSPIDVSGGGGRGARADGSDDRGVRRWLIGRRRGRIHPWAHRASPFADRPTFISKREE